MNELNPVLAWVVANKTHVFAVVGTTVALVGYFSGLLTWEQTVAVAGACGGLSLLRHDNSVDVNNQTKQIDVDNKQALKAQTRDIVQKTSDVVEDSK